MRILGVREGLGDLSLDDFQRYVLKRSREPGKRGLRVSVGTIRKELATLTTLWNWAAQHKYVVGPLPKAGLKFPKLDEHPPFQTLIDGSARTIADEAMSTDIDCAMSLQVFTRQRPSIIRRSRELSNSSSASTANIKSSFGSILIERHASPLRVAKVLQVASTSVTVPSGCHNSTW